MDMPVMGWVRVRGLTLVELLVALAVAARSPSAKAYITRRSTNLRLTLLEPAIIQSILAGQQPRCMSLLWFQRNPLPTDWVSRREVVVGFDS